VRDVLAIRVVARAKQLDGLEQHHDGLSLKGLVAVVARKMPLVNDASGVDVLFELWDDSHQVVRQYPKLSGFIATNSHPFIVSVVKPPFSRCP
jgi:hypothetical protein